MKDPRPASARRTPEEKAARARQKIVQRDLDVRLLRAWGLSAGHAHEHHFHPTKRWRFDWAWPEFLVALEIEGGRWVRGRHNRAEGFAKDIEKYNAAAILGWIVIRCDPSDFRAGRFAESLKAALRGRGWGR